MIKSHQFQQLRSNDIRQTTTTINQTTTKARKNKQQQQKYCKNRDNNTTTNNNNNRSQSPTATPTKSKLQYVKNFSQSLLALQLKQSVLGFNFTNNNASLKWLQDLRMMSENECLCVLQAKSLINKLAKQKAAESQQQQQQQLQQQQQQQQKQQRNKQHDSQISTSSSCHLFDPSTSKMQRDQQSTRSFVNQQHESSSSSSIKSASKASIVSDYTNVRRHDSSQAMKLVNEDDKIYEILDYMITKTVLINDEFVKVYRKIDKSNYLHTFDLLRRLMNQIQININLFNNKCLSNYEYLLTFKNSKNHNILFPLDILEENFNSTFKFKFVEEAICKLIAQIKKLSLKLHIPDEQIDKNELLECLRTLGETFNNYHNNATRFCIFVQMSKLNKRDASLSFVEKHLNLTFDVCLKSEAIKKLIIEFNGILLLFSLLKEPYFKSILDLVLRTLSILCSCFESFRSLKQLDSFGLLTDILCDENAQEWTRTEAAGCVAQITSPSLDFCHSLVGFYENMQDLIRALTILCRDSSDIEIFLIGTAALANLTFIDNVACEHLNQFSTAQVLIENFYLKNYNSIFVKDQIITIIANMALLENCRAEIVEFNGLSLIADFLNERPSNYISYSASASSSSASSSSASSYDFNNNTNNSRTNNKNIYEPELLACERVQQKSAIAISRFCKEKQYSMSLIDLSIVPRLVCLCRNSAERNNSDSVLVACLAALRQLSNNCNSRLMMDETVQDLIKPKLKDSFFICSTAESYV